MRTRLSVSSVCLLIVLGYMASPYVALWRLQTALERGDATSLEQGIDWKSVREGLKHDIADGVIGPVETQLAANSLPPFGASFVKGIADNAVERDVTPQNLIAVMRQMPSGGKSANPFSCCDWAFFESPTAFTVTVSNPASDPDDGHLRLRMEMHNGRWTLMRAWIPQDIVERAAQRT